MSERSLPVERIVSIVTSGLKPRSDLPFASSGHLKHVLVRAASELTVIVRCLPNDIVDFLDYHPILDR